MNINESYLLQANLFITNINNALQCIYNSEIHTQMQDLFINYQSAFNGILNECDNYSFIEVTISLVRYNKFYNQIKTYNLELFGWLLNDLIRINDKLIQRLALLTNNV
jgi:hypothetical protein